MKILCLQESDWFERGPLQSHHLMERLSNRGHDVRVIDFETHWREYKREKIINKRKTYENVHKATNKSNVTLIRPMMIKLPILDYLSLLYAHRIEIKKQINQFKPDVIIGFGILNSNITINLIKKSKIPFIYYIIDELHKFVPQKLFQKFAKRIESKNMTNADLVISINEQLREYTIQMGANRGKTEVIRGGVEIERFKSDPNIRRNLRKQYNFNKNDLVLFFMGILYTFSGLREISLKLAEINDSNIKLLIIGKGNEWNKINDIKNSNNLKDNIILIDWQPYERIPDLISTSDICILPAQNKQVMKNIVPIKIYEYMAAGKPVITTKLEGIMKEFCSGNGIFYVEMPEDVLKKSIELRNKHLIRQEGKKARDFVIKYNNWDSIIQTFENTLREIILTKSKINL